MKIRADLEGVVYVGGHVLAAGDDVPAGVTVGDHLLEKGASGGTGKRRGRASTPRASSDG